MDDQGICISRAACLLAVVSVLVAASAGCRRGTAPEVAESVDPGKQLPPSSTEPEQVSGTLAPLSPARTKHSRSEVWVDEKGQKWFGNVPMDAFFDEPYAVASDQSSLDPASPLSLKPDSAPTPEIVSTPVASASEVTAVDASTPPSSAGGDDSWGALISAAALDEEVKSIRNFMNENLNSVGTFNASMLMLPQKAATLGALAEVAAKHPEAISWKDDAAWIRDLAKKMNSSTLQRGAKDQKRVLELYEAVSDTLNRSRPASLEEPVATDSFAETAEMRLLMMRMDEAEKRMRTEAGTEGAMSSRKAMILQEASLMAVMAKIVTLPGYGYEDDSEFKGFGDDVVKAAQSIKLAAESSDFASYEGALTKISTTCQNCHTKYKND